MRDWYETTTIPQIVPLNKQSARYPILTLYQHMVQHKGLDTPTSRPGQSLSPSATINFATSLP